MTTYINNQNTNLCTSVNLYQLKMAQAPVLKHELRLFLSAEHLKSCGSASDSFFRLSVVQPNGYLDRYHEGTVIMDNNNPKWTSDVSVTLDLESNRKFRCEVFDYDDSGKHELIGHVDFVLSADVIDGQQTLGLIKAGKTKASKKMKLIIKGEPKVVSNLIIKADFRCTDLTKTYFFSKDTTAISLHRLNADGSDSQLTISEWIHGTQEPNWRCLTVQFADLCDADMTKPFILKMWRLRSRDGYMEPKGENRRLTVQDCLKNKGDKQKKIDLFDEDTGKDICDIWIERFEFVKG